MQTKREIIYLAGFLFSLPIALTAYINSSFLQIYAGPYYVGALYILSSIITIWSLSGLPQILTKYGNRRTALIFSVLIFVAFLLLALSGNIFLAVPAFILFFAASNLLYISLDIFIEDFSGHIPHRSTIGRFRGWYLMILNSAWVIAQLISGSVIARSSYRGIYLLSAGFMILVSAIFLLALRDFKDPGYKKMPVGRTIKYFLRNKHISKIYILNFILKFFFAWMIIYTPIYLHEYIGFGWSQIGLIFTIMLLPFVILEFPLGMWSDKIGEKEMLLAGFSISALFTLVIPFIPEPRLWLWAGVLFATRVGAATIEVMSENYFFKLVREENADAISFFRNTGPLSYIIAPLLAIPILLFVPSFEYLFYILGAILLVGLLITLRIKDVQ
ncbi:hypothetical protein A3G06_00145 [Candidatus Nomurabacteria bacterium RIFCSPLOWO2_12_FULL_46_14]|uniref:Major facilitator superfamily (MFS) profile domain-containing protein n=1 Tax=Candidatus Nomurabacteria bacterium RIFCSPLOWO2_12_FULL_46_14 TaxID=1801797 RepID=A0A1F6YCA9_9BACT|nr:MAG: hypothetical protein A3G06_00145 [Candidatus Nomurabacteria bacterium RIFCSPLOWO2_12_FULL_46_14]